MFRLIAEFLVAFALVSGPIWASWVAYGAGWL